MCGRPCGPCHEVDAAWRVFAHSHCWPLVTCSQKRMVAESYAVSTPSSKSRPCPSCRKDLVEGRSHPRDESPDRLPRVSHERQAASLRSLRSHRANGSCARPLSEGDALCSKSSRSPAPSHPRSCLFSESHGARRRCGRKEARTREVGSFRITSRAAQCAATERIRTLCARLSDLHTTRRGGRLAGGCRRVSYEKSSQRRSRSHAGRHPIW